MKIYRSKKSLGLRSDYRFVRAKKALGQNFLKSIPALNAIIKAGEVGSEDTILEIGPGKGALTAKLLENAGKVIAIEKDRELLNLLQEKFAIQIENKKLILLEGDILEFLTNVHDLNSGTYKIIANIPYNITGAILKKFLTDKKQPELMVLMVQNEVAQRIVARDSKESILSISVKAYGEPKMVMKVPARYFSPAPKVDSAIISIKNISRQNFTKNGTNEEKFWELVKLGFSHKRKKLSGNLKAFNPGGNASGVGVKTEWEKRLIEISAKNKRAEDLSLSDWITLVS